MIVERSMHEGFLSNAYLAGPDGGGAGFVVDPGAPLGPLFAAAQRHGIEPTHVLLTHHHWDHISELPELVERWPRVEVLIDARERDLLAGSVPDLARHLTGDLAPGDELTIGGIDVKALHTPGHTSGMLSLLADGGCFTGDTLFKNSVGGVRAPGSTSYADLRDSVMDVLMTLPADTVLHPGHTDPTTVAQEWENNAFVRVWRGLDAEGDEPCTALGEPATLILWGDDYDGGHKAWIRWPDGRDDIVPGSKVLRG